MRRSFGNLFPRRSIGRQSGAQAAAHAEQRSEALARLTHACRERAEAAAAIDRAYADLAAAVDRLAKADDVIILLRGFASPGAVMGDHFGVLRITALVKLAEARAQIPGVISFLSPDESESTIAAVERDNATILEGFGP